jgi:molybdopterin-synthase adenylyltransferase
VSDEDRQVREAGGPGRDERKGLLIAKGGLAAELEARPPIAASPTRYRLKRSVEVFAAADGRVFLMCPGTGEDFVLPSPSPAERAVLECLAAEPVTKQVLANGASEPLQAERCLHDLVELGLVERLHGGGLLSGAQAERYDRQLVYWADLAGPEESADLLQRRLAEAKVVVLGCGGLGSWAAAGLACAGVGELVLVDDDRVETSNLNRQLLFGEADLGGAKVDVAARALVRHNSELRVTGVRRRVSGPGDLEDCLGGASFLIAAADWPPYRLQRWVNRACLDAGVAYVTAGQFLPRVRIGPLVVPGGSACWECIERQARDEHPDYDEVATRPPRASTAATLGAASGIVGSLMAMEAIHYLTGAVDPATTGTSIVVDLRTLELAREQLRADPNCPSCGGTGDDGPPDPRGTHITAIAAPG